MLGVSQFRSRIFSDSRKVFPCRRKKDRSVVVVLNTYAPAEGALFEVSGFCYFQDRRVARRFYSNLQDLIRVFEGREGSHFESSFRKI